MGLHTFGYNYIQVWNTVLLIYPCCLGDQVAMDQNYAQVAVFFFHRSEKGDIETSVLPATWGSVGKDNHNSGLCTVGVKGVFDPFEIRRVAFRPFLFIVFRTPNHVNTDKDDFIAEERKVLWMVRCLPRHAPKRRRIPVPCFVVQEVFSPVRKSSIREVAVCAAGEDCA
jgi:hypothetical protein